MENRNFRIISILVALTLLISARADADTLSTSASTIELPSIPSSLTDVSQRADYLIAHYWDNLNVGDTVISHNDALIEQSTVDYISILPYASSAEVIEESIVGLLKKAHEDKVLYKNITRIFDDYLSNQDSPVFSEPLYLNFLSSLLKTSFLNEAEKARVEDKIYMTEKNLPGTKAADFTFETSEGKQTSLYEQLKNSDAEKSLLIFFDPECDNCDAVIQELITNSALEKKLKEKELQILTIYEGENKISWQKKISTFPESWISGITYNEIEDNDLYYLPEMPTIYILGKYGTVEKRSYGRKIK